MQLQFCCVLSLFIKVFNLFFLFFTFFFQVLFILFQLYFQLFQYIRIQFQLFYQFSQFLSFYIRLTKFEMLPWQLAKIINEQFTSNVFEGVTSKNNVIVILNIGIQTGISVYYNQMLVNAYPISDHFYSTFLQQFLSVCVTMLLYALYIVCKRAVYILFFFTLFFPQK